MKLTLQK